MEVQAAQAAHPTRGRVVMLVDNGVKGDSRVQKSAQSAADAGWDVILVGLRTRGSVEQTWRIGGAQVQLVAVHTPLGQHSPLQRRGWLRRPWAYPPGKVPAYRLQWARAWRTDLNFRSNALTVARAAGGSPARYALGRAWLLPQRAAARAAHLWVRFRNGQLYRLQRARKNPKSLLTSANIAFWKAVRGKRAWRQLDSALWDFELSLGPVVDRLQPDIIHANDFRMIGVGARAAMRARVKGRDVKLVWDAHEFVPGLTGRDGNPRWLPAQVGHEREYAPYADAVVTVSPALADLLQRDHRLPEKPTVVLNAPVCRPKDVEDDTPRPDLRALCRVSAETPLLAYCGGITPVRGVEVIIDGLVELPDVHVALVSLHPNGNRVGADVILARAQERGVIDRVHLLPYVRHWEVAPFLADADAAVSPLLHLPNHEIALSNKFLEYSQARLPIITSDIRTMAEMVSSTGQGEVFRAQDVADYVRAVRAVLADPQRYRAAYDAPGLLDGWTWEVQAEILDRVYRRLMTA
jgi:glycosyltransferase involved in cell wall biosynthesis